MTPSEFALSINPNAVYSQCIDCRYMGRFTCNQAVLFTLWLQTNNYKVKNVQRYTISYGVYFYADR